MLTNKNAKRILVFGDSYVFGKIPGGARYDSESRFTGVLQKTLGDGFDVIEEGLVGRVVDGENRAFQYRNGFPQFGPILGSHFPLDLVIFFLGTNDLNSGSDKSPEEVAKGYEGYMERVTWWSKHLDFPMPKIMIVAPPFINERASYKLFGAIFKGSESRIRKLSKVLEKFARSKDLLFFDSSSVVTVSETDGVYLSKEENKKLGEALAGSILKIKFEI